MHIHYREADLIDVDEIVDFFSSSVRFSNFSIKKFLTFPSFSVIGILTGGEVNQRIIAFITVKYLSEGEYWVENVMVHDDLRLRGYGTQLVQKAEEIILSKSKIKSLRSLRLLTTPSNQPMKKICQKMDYKLEGKLHLFLWESSQEPFKLDENTIRWNKIDRWDENVYAFLGRIVTTLSFERQIVTRMETYSFSRKSVDKQLKGSNVIGGWNSSGDLVVALDVSPRYLLLRKASVTVYSNDIAILPSIWYFISNSYRKSIDFIEFILPSELGNKLLEESSSSISQKMIFEVYGKHTNL